ncbi:hypothetical protein CE91St46_10910 [Eubacteriales bacterium]|uniref:ParB N-terminal domain-containing protein n=1 Tax=Anaerotruncus TaxID=244127 RepID=UPI0013143FA6|nr:ParB N-terminal domain-containing protein [Anaerotruncus sp. AF02-27]MCM0707196.1 ParB N-terminal domain-containing protein [Faecalicatena sp. BF-R-105]GKH48142.1 hypothetical protein CE91St45_27040 [Oscillospiraceae bacterium]GKH49980.1 hypothetical protein CE91St46_10910 [Eubacteriales bacterium]GKH62616.1 hypothetical protein CE91St47_10850 [Eubacteriales bacterium]
MASDKNAMPTLDTLFGGAEISENEITLIDDALIDEFPGHPYRLYTGKRHTDLLDSIREFGVLSPVILRAEPTGRYTLLAGYNRRHCNRIAGNKQLPSVVMYNVSDGDAKLIITHSNRQRGLDELLPSEKAFAFKMELEGLKETRREQKKVAAIEALEKAVNADEQDDSGKLFKFEQGEYTRDILAKQYGLKATEVQRLIRLTHLCPNLLDLVDEGKIADYVAVPLTYLSEDMQAEVFHQMTERGYRVDIDKAELLKRRFQEKKLTADKIADILAGKETVKKVSTKSPVVKLQPATVKRYFTRGESAKEIQTTIEKALALYFSQQRQEER